MNDLIDQLLGHNSASTNSPAKRSEIIAIENLFNAPLPEALAKLWRKSDGVSLDSINCHILSLNEVSSILSEDPWDWNLKERGLLPILDDHESNLIAVYLQGPRSFRVVHVPHDDGSRMLYRDMDSFLADLIRCADQDLEYGPHAFDTSGDYAPDDPRPQEDQDAARELIAGSHTRDEWNHAAQLLDSSNLLEWRILLETDHFIRRDVRQRMSQMSSSQIQAILAEDTREFEAFAQLVEDSARKAGLPVAGRGEENLKIAKQWMNLDVFFYRRNIPNAIPRMILWFEDLLANRDPRLRPYHFMTD